MALCDVRDDNQIEAVFDIARQWGRLDFLVHSIAFAPKEDLHSRVVDCSRDGFLLAMNVSCYSFIRMAKLAEPLMKDSGCLLTMSYYGAEKVVEHYTTSWDRSKPPWSARCVTWRPNLAPRGSWCTPSHRARSRPERDPGSTTFRHEASGSRHHMARAVTAVGIRHAFSLGNDMPLSRISFSQAYPSAARACTAVFSSGWSSKRTRASQ
jgi:Enoyl-[acyl-carrier-protein] reductase (NADH)